MYSHTRMDLIKPKKRFIKSIFIYVPITTMQTSRTQDLTSGSITQSMLNLAYPLMAGCITGERIKKFCIEPDYLRTQQKKTSKMLLLNAFFVAGPGIEPGTS